MSLNGSTAVGQSFAADKAKLRRARNWNVVLFLTLVGVTTVSVFSDRSLVITKTVETGGEAEVACDRAVAQAANHTAAYAVNAAWPMCQQLHSDLTETVECVNIIGRGADEATHLALLDEGILEGP